MSRQRKEEGEREILFPNAKSEHGFPGATIFQYTETRDLIMKETSLHSALSTLPAADRPLHFWYQWMYSLHTLPMKSPNNGLRRARLLLHLFESPTSTFLFAHSLLQLPCILCCAMHCLDTLIATSASLDAQMGAYKPRCKISGASYLMCVEQYYRTTFLRYFHGRPI